MEHAPVASSQHLRSKAEQEHSLYPCLWLRGIQPLQLVTIEYPLPTRRHIAYRGCPPEGEWPGGEYYGDGSGGRYNKYLTLRRVGVGIVKYSASVVEFGCLYPLPGDVQTVPRGEISALATVLEKVAPDQHVDFYTDHQPGGCHPTCRPILITRDHVNGNAQCQVGGAPHRAG